MLTIRQFLLLFFSSLWNPFSPKRDVYFHTRGNQQLVFFGSIHSHNPKDPMYKEMETVFTNFLQNSTNTKKVVLLEGPAQNLSSSNSLAQIIENEGDRGFAYFIASGHNILTVNADMNKNAVVKLLVKQYSLNAVHAWARERFVYMWQRFPSGSCPLPSCDDYVNYHLDEWFKDINRTHLQEISLSFNDIKKITDTYLLMRQRYTFEVIQNYWNLGYDIFIVFGNAHAVAHRYNITTLLK